MALHPKARRLGDLAAGTVVVRDRPVESTQATDGADLTEEILAAPVLAD
jgi:uncharacterized RDD family membrane protein YckC